MSPDPETVLAAIRECVTVVKPGEVLAVRVPGPCGEEEFAMMREAGERAREFGVRIIFIEGEQFARLATAEVP